MKTVSTLILIALLSLLGSKIAAAQTDPGTPGTPGSPATTQSTTDTTGVSAGTGVVIETRYVPTRGYTRAAERARRANAEEAARIDKQLTQMATQIDKGATRDGNAKIAERLASDFGLRSDSLAAQRTRYGVGWGDLLIAHTLYASRDTTVADSAVTLDDIFRMRSDRMGWGQIASGLDLRMGDVVPTIRTQSRVATGEVRANGRPEIIPSVSTRTGTQPGNQSGNSGQPGNTNQPGSANQPGNTNQSGNNQPNQPGNSQNQPGTTNPPGSSNNQPGNTSPGNPQGGGSGGQR
jgi:hypothetical protein